MDGTLMDSAPDLLHITKTILQEEGEEIPDDDDLRPCISDGAMGLLKRGFGTDDENKLTDKWRRFYDYYSKDPVSQGSRLFPHLEGLADLLTDTSWGIVTNKTRGLTLPIINKVGILKGHQVLVCGDDLEFMKPHPMPIMHACSELDVAPQDTLFVGDSSKDIIAGKAAGTATLAVLYGYIAKDEDATEWGADYYAKTTLSLLEMLGKLVLTAQKNTI